MKAFFDTNVLIYLIEQDRERAKAVRHLLIEEDGHISVQVLNEFVSTARRKMVEWDVIRTILGELRLLLHVLPLTLPIHDRGLIISERFGYHIYDSLLLGAALEGSCSVFWSEDLQHGQVIEGRLTIRNPFV